MLAVNLDVAVEKYEEMKLNEQHAYIVVRIIQDKDFKLRCSIDREVKKADFQNNCNALIKSKMMIIISYLFRKYMNGMKHDTDI